MEDNIKNDMNNDLAAKIKRRISWKKIIAIALIAAIAVCVLLHFLLPAYNFYPRKMNWGMSIEEVMEREKVSFTKIEREWGTILASDEKVKLRGYDAVLVYMFLNDGFTYEESLNGEEYAIQGGLQSVCYYIYSDNSEEAKQTSEYFLRWFSFRDGDIVSALINDVHAQVFTDRRRKTTVTVNSPDANWYDPHDLFWQEHRTEIAFSSSNWSRWISSTSEQIYQKGSLVSSGKYYIRNKESGQYLDASVLAGSANINIVQRPFNGGESQIWQITQQGKGIYTISPSEAADIYMQPEGKGAGKNVIQGKGEDSNPDIWWRLLSNDDGTYRITMYGSTTWALDNGGSLSDGGNVYIENYNGGESQQWVLEPAGE